MEQDQLKLLKNANYEEKKELIEGFGIYELRGFARALGISSPTTKKREELISLIMNSLDSDEPLTPKTTSKGRPFKKLKSIDSFLEVFSDKGNTASELPKFYSYEDIAIFAQETPIFEYQSSEVMIMKGVLRIVKKTAYFIDLNGNDVVFISTQDLNRLNLQNGDLLEVSAYRINESKQYYAKDILFINGTPADEYRVEDVEMSKTIPTISRDVEGSRIVLGGRNYLMLNSPLYMNSEIRRVLENFEKNGDMVIFLGVNMCFEDRELIKSYKNIINFTSEYGGDFSKDFDKIVDAISLAQRLPELNKNVVVITYDIINLLNSLDIYFISSESVRIFGHLQPSSVIAKKLISLSSAYTTGKDCTNIFICNELDSNDEFVRNEVMKISNKM